MRRPTPWLISTAASSIHPTTRAESSRKTMMSSGTSPEAASATGKANMKLYAHVFGTRALLTRHLNNDMCEDVARSVSKSRDSYTDNLGDTHKCFVINNGDDISRLRGHTFAGHWIH